MTRVSEPVHGVLLLDKPHGVSSNHALQRVRFALGAAKAGHTGSLDPLATGMLPLCFGEATKVAGLLLGAHKRYRAEFVLGVATTTDDGEGEVVSTREVTNSVCRQVHATLATFVGRIRQRPPIYSALKQQGVPLYKRVRRGEVVETPEREAEVFAIDHVIQNGLRVHAEIECGSGTYIRSIARDLGERLGCGAHLGALRRLWVDPFQGQIMISLDEVLVDGIAMRGRLLPLSSALSQFPATSLDAENAQRFQQGQPTAASIAPSSSPIMVRGLDDALLGLGKIDADGRLWPQRVFNGL
ncbi:MAG: tRNA pseudouridine(55) synthase TruB [Lysobacterales bacterium]